MLATNSLLKIQKTTLLCVLACIVCYFTFAYNLIRTDYIRLIALYSGLFFLFYKLIQQLKNNTKALTYIAFVFRAVFILAIPNLSQDFYRFIWDGRMLLQGFNPYLYNVESFINEQTFPVSQAQILFEGMGSLNASHFTNYPPINQLCFFIGALLANKSILGSVVVLRLLIIAADFGTLHFGKKLLYKLNLPEHYIFWYILNPFIIIELTGNLHFEGVMIFFLIWSLYLLHQKKWQWAAVVFALSISTKLIPIILLPLFLKWFSINKQHWDYKRLFVFYSLIILTTIAVFIPFYSNEFITNYYKTVGLWFTTFEFNASIYYVARSIGYAFRGYNEIAIIGQGISVLTIIFTLAIALLRKNDTTRNLITSMLLVLSLYFFISTTVHPWYIATLLILSIFTEYKFPLVWSFVVILSYLSYLNVDSSDKSENLWIIGLEYGIVYGYFIWEIGVKKAAKKQLS